MSGFQDRRRSSAQQAAAMLAAVVAAQQPDQPLPTADIHEPREYPPYLIDWTLRSVPHCGAAARAPLTDRIVRCTLNTGHPGRHMAGVRVTEYAASWE